MNRNVSAIAILGFLALGPLSLGSEPSIVVSIEPGASYTHKARIGLISLTLTPQMAVWIESPDGAYVDTIYVTGKSAGAKWSAAGGERRPEALPVWSRARGVAAQDGVFMPDKKHPLPDAVSGATPTEAQSFAWKAPPSLAPGSYAIKVELNSSYDWNEAYPDKLPKSDPRYSAVNGQPSLVFEARLETGRGAASVLLEPVGTGSLRGEDGKLAPTLEGLTTALELLGSARAEFRP
jgi:hypothetical protein